jgi:hypothetical protein
VFLVQALVQEQELAQVLAKAQVLELVYLALAQVLVAQLEQMEPF